MQVNVCVALLLGCSACLHPWHCAQRQVDKVGCTPQSAKAAAKPTPQIARPMAIGLVKPR